MAIKHRPEIPTEESSTADLLESVNASFQANSIFPVPTDEDFSGNEFMEAPELEQVVDQIIAFYPAKFGWLQRYAVECCWKRKGGSSKGKPVWAKKPTLASGLLHFKADADYYIVLNADNIRDSTLSQFHVKSLLIHELCYMVQDDNGKPSLVDPDVVAFAFEVETCGLWRKDLQTFGRAVQLSFEDAED